MIMDCPKCKSSHHVKDGIVNGGRQRYKCKDCLYRFTVVRKSDVKNLTQGDWRSSCIWRVFVLEASAGF